MLDDLALVTPERVVSEDPAEDAERLGLKIYCGSHPLILRASARRGPPELAVALWTGAAYRRSF
ncbi:hypothetical protein GCM10022251_78670 [Phytohabitans flavus]|uniref:Uncharacterized protein n=1 Tax=Phytohabitans flavus TaxID=1076124 RepID=A0A6F8XY59_9ACTN|nr:hypothetical protein Pflav_051470 [Phytohabitans flavus]